MDKSKSIFFILLFIISSVSVLGLEPDDKVYFDNLNQKTIAQLSAKIDSSKAEVGKQLRTEFQDSTEYIDAEVKRLLFSAIRILAIGLAGFMILILGIFKILDLKITKTRAIEKYEKELENKIKLNDTYKFELDGYRDRLIKLHEEIKALQGQKVDKKEIPIKQELKTQKKKGSFWIWFFVVIIALGLITLAILYLPSLMKPKILTGLN